MIALLSQTEADRQGIDPRHVQCITPYLNPAHVLSPPRRWLEALVSEEYSWNFFRLRYKNLLHNRYRAEPQRFHALLEASAGGEPLYLTCHCLTAHCHREIARDYLEMLRRRIAAKAEAEKRIPVAPAIPMPQRLPRGAALSLLTGAELLPPRPGFQQAAGAAG